MKTSLNTGIGFISVNWNRFKNFIMEDSNEISKKQKKILKHFNLYDVFAYSEASKQLELMKEPIANFAKKNNIVIDVYENVKRDTGDKILTTYVRKADKSAEVIRDIDANTKIVYPKEAEKIYLLNIKGEDTQVARNVKSSREDNFLENFFRNIEEMTEAVKKQ
ncbi:MAG: hypothetical protein VZR09_08420 [Candidatus Gastranaerophilaceae bacterium]|nr:hypothetical protein [Candidatus Gastranaerophilaceae bacterium]